jgi:hypothetical protein
VRPDQLFVANLAAVGVAAALVGLLVRERARLCWSFTAYLALALVTNRLVVWWPARFHTWGFWSAKETLSGALVAGIVLELAWVAFAGWPRARQFTLLFVLAVVGLTGAAVADLAGDASRQGWIRLVAATQTGPVWAAFALVAVRHWYMLPMHAWHRTVTLGIVLYGGVYAALLGLVAQYGPTAYTYLAALDPVLYVATVVLWVLAAWRPEERTSLSTEARRELQPWARA